MIDALDDLYYESTFTNTKTDTKPRDTIRKIFDERNSIDLEPLEIIDQEKFISIAEKVHLKYPLLFLPTFIDDFMNGVWTRELIVKYDINDYLDFNYLQNKILNFKGKRKKQRSLIVFKDNYKQNNWKEQYDFLKQHCKIFANQFQKIYNNDLLSAIIIFYLFEKNTAQYTKTIFENIKNIVDTYIKIIPIRDDENLVNAFLEFISELSIKQLDDLIANLKKQDYINYNAYEKQIQLYFGIDELTIEILEFLKMHPDGVAHRRLQKHLITKNQILRLVPSVELIEGLILKMRQSNLIIVKQALGQRAQPFENQIFLQNNYTTKIESIKEEVQVQKRKFFGRTIDPDTFIEELLKLNKGDFQDTDDQVTRLAGLVLAESDMLMAPHEKLDIFDFAIDLSDYHFRPEQIEVMNEINFRITGNILHAKVMISETVTEEIIQQIKEKLPQGEQAIIFTFTEISLDILKLIPTDSSIQFIDKTGIQAWLKITNVLPSRSGWIVKIRYGDHMNKLAKINSINYESGLASIIIIPTLEESNVFIGSLEELTIIKEDVDEFETFMDNYFQLLCSLANSSPDLFYEGMCMNIEKTFTNKFEFLKYTNPALFNGIHPKYSDDQLKTNDIRYVVINNLHTEINIHNGDFQCECKHHINEEHYYTLCPHVISAINHICVIDPSDIVLKNERIKILQEKLEEFYNANIERVVDALHEMIDPKHAESFKKYLKVYAD